MNYMQHDAMVDELEERVDDLRTEMQCHLADWARFCDLDEDRAVCLSEGRGTANIERSMERHKEGFELYSDLEEELETVTRDIKRHEAASDAAYHQAIFDENPKGGWRS
jgi:exonuclease VII small subunit